MWTLQNFKFADILMSNDPSHHFTALCVSHKIGTMHLYVFKFAGLLKNMLSRVPTAKESSLKHELHLFITQKVLLVMERKNI